VWYDDRPPGQQPSPTSCGSAQREAYRTNGRVIYGGDERRDEWDRGDDERWDRDGDRDRECDEKDRAKGECGWDGRDDDRRDDRRRDRDDMCRDSDRDGRCDYAESRYPDARYPGGRRYPATLPDMVWGVIFGRGDRAAVRGVRQWLATSTPTGTVGPRRYRGPMDGASSCSAGSIRRATAAPTG
jgi:hypothetical protein